MSLSSPPAAGKVYLVGAGPGDAGLITLKGVECLRRADLVLHDYLVNPSLLRHASPSAEIVALGRHGQKKGISQDEINARMVLAACQGKVVVRLKGGDPDVFGRSADEIAALDAVRVPYETVPGVTAATAVAAFAGIPITHADYSSALALVTGQERHSKAAGTLDYAALASFPGTLVFYMGVTSARTWSEALLNRGKPADTPVAIVRRCSWPDQQVIRCTLARVAEVIEARQLRPPAVIVVGQVVALAPERSWFAARTLFGRRVLVTRARHQIDDLAGLLGEQGAEVLIQPAIEIAPPTDWEPVDRALEALERYDWLVFSSANGVRFLLDRLCQTPGDLRAGPNQAGGDWSGHGRGTGKVPASGRSRARGVSRGIARQGPDPECSGETIPLGSRQSWPRGPCRRSRGGRCQSRSNRGLPEHRRGSG